MTKSHSQTTFKETPNRQRKRDRTKPGERVSVSKGGQEAVSHDDFDFYLLVAPTDSHRFAHGE